MDNVTIGQIAKAIGSIGVISGAVFGIFKWIETKVLNRIDKLENDVSGLKIDSKDNKEENMILLKAQLACLKGLKEQGCNGPVTESIHEIEQYLIEKNHR